MHDLIEWLITIEDLAGNLYLDSSNYFKNEKPLSEILFSLSEDESYHFHFLENAERYLNKTGIQIQPEFILNNEIKSRIENPLNDNFKLLKENNISIKDIIQGIGKTEFSEWNDLFIYVVNNLKSYDKRFQLVASNIQDHLKRVKELLSLYEEGIDYLERLKRLPSVWEKVSYS